MNSNMVHNYATQVASLINDAKSCSNDMTKAISGISGYWTELGSAEFTNNCQTWIRQMKELEQTLTSIRNGMQAHAYDLSVREAEQKRQEAEAQAAKASASGKKK